MDGQDTVHLGGPKPTGSGIAIDIWVDAATYLPVHIAIVSPDLSCRRRIAIRGGSDLHRRHARRQLSAPGEHPARLPPTSSTSDAYFAEVAQPSAYLSGEWFRAQLV